jgi:hypothetical protein
MSQPADREDTPAAAAGRGGALWSAAAVFVLGFIIYNLNAIPISSDDNRTALLLPHALLTRGSIDLTPYYPAGLAEREPVPYFITWRKPLLSSNKLVFHAIVATPFYAAGWAAVRLLHGPLPELHFDHFHDPPPLPWFAVEKIAASLTAAATGSVMLLALWVYWRRHDIAWGGALAFAFLTGHWCTSSQGLWNHGTLGLLTAVVALAWATLERTSAAAGYAPTRYLLVGSLAAAWLMPVRPTGAGYALAWLGYVGWRWRSHLGWVAAPVAAMAVVNFSFNLWIADSIAGYYGARAGPFWVYGWAENFKAWAGLLVSPGAGLFVFTPLAGLAVAGAWFAWRRTGREERALRGWVWPVLFCYVAAATNTDPVPQLRWHAAASYGPRYFVDALPALTFLGIWGALALWRATVGRPPWRRVLLGATVAGAALWSAGTQVVGVFFFKFNHALRPLPIHRSLERLWEWRDNPVCREIRTGVNPDVITAWSVFTGAAAHPVALDAPQPIAEVTAPAVPARFAPEERRMLEVEVRNLLGTAWPGSRQYGFSPPLVDGRWWSAAGTSSPAVPEPTHLPLLCGLAAGGVCRLPVLVAAPAEPGVYRLQLGLHQSGRWLGEPTPPELGAATTVIDPESAKR